MAIRIKRVRRRPAALPPGPGGPYRDDPAAYPLEARRDELHVYVARPAQWFVMATVVAVWAAAMLGPLTVPGVAAGAVAAWLAAVAGFGQRRFRLSDGLVEVAPARVWTPSLRSRLRGGLRAVRVRQAPPTSTHTDRPRPGAFRVIVCTSAGELELCSSTEPSEAYALAALIDEHFGLVAPAEPIGPPDADEGA